MMESGVKDYTWPICKDCVNRVFRVFQITLYDPESGEVRGEGQECYVCRLGIELDKHPNQCKYKVPRGVRT